MTESFGSGSEFVNQRLVEETLVDGGEVPKVKMVNSPSIEVKVGGNTEEVIFVGKQG
jgi:hypothetical protein